MSVANFMSFFHRTPKGQGLNMSEVIEGKDNYTVGDVFRFMRKPAIYKYRKTDYISSTGEYDPEHEIYIIYDKRAFDGNVIDDYKSGTPKFRELFGFIAYLMDRYIYENRDTFDNFSVTNHAVVKNYSKIVQDDSSTGRIGGVSFVFPGSAETQHTAFVKTISTYFDAQTCLVNHAFLNEASDRENYYNYLIRIDRRESVVNSSETEEHEKKYGNEINPIIDMYRRKERWKDYTLTTVRAYEHHKYLGPGNYEEAKGEEVFITFSYFKPGFESDGRFTIYQEDLARWFIENDEVWGVGERWENIVREFPTLFLTNSLDEIYLIPAVYKLEKGILDNKVLPFLNIKTVGKILDAYKTEHTATFFRTNNVELFFMDFTSIYDFNMTKLTGDSKSFSTGDSISPINNDENIDEVVHKIVNDKSEPEDYESDVFLTGKPHLFPIVSIRPSYKSKTVGTLILDYKTYSSSDNRITNDRASMFHMNLKFIFNVLLRTPYDSQLGENKVLTDKVGADIVGKLKEVGINCTGVRIVPHNTENIGYIAEICFIFCGQKFVACSYIDLFQS